jgi:hypothetical protein
MLTFSSFIVGVVGSGKGMSKDVKLGRHIFEDGKDDKSTGPSNLG